MATRSSKTRHIVRGIGLGVAATMLVLGLRQFEFVRQLERHPLDFRFRRLPTITASDDICQVYIDDPSLDQISRWPWPRRRLAQLVDVLRECGARSVTLDILLPHPQSPRYVRPGVTDLYEGSTDDMLDPGNVKPIQVFDDIELTQALRRSPDLFLGMTVDITKPDRIDARQQLIRSLAEHVTTRPALTRKQTATETGLPLATVEKVMVPVKEAALRPKIRSILSREPAISRRDITARLLGKVVGRNEDVDIIRRVYLAERALAQVRRFVIPASSITGLNVPPGRPSAPLVTFAEAINHTGFVTVDPDEDGVVRQLPLLLKTDQGVFPQLALALAAQTLADSHGGDFTISAEPGEVIITFADGFRRRIPVDHRGYMLVNWCRRGSIPHISVLAAADVWQAREALANNRILRLMAFSQLAQLAFYKYEGKELDQDFVRTDLVAKDLREARQARHAALLFEPGSAAEIPPELLKKEAELEARIDRACVGLLSHVDDLIGKKDDRIDEEWLLYRRWIRMIDQEQPRIRRQLDQAMVTLRSQVGGKVCLVGSMATGAADFVPTPVHERAPGVDVHANVLNTILAGKFVRPTGDGMSAGLVLLVGGVGAVVPATRGPIQSAALLASTALGYAILDGIIWTSTTYWMIIVAPIAAMLLCFTAVTVYRQLTEARQRRMVTSQFKQFLSPVMVDMLADDPTQANPRRCELSNFFSDLAGFTALSERMGPEGTVAVINRYLEYVGRIIWDSHRGTLSKYEGDGVFAFFNAPLPQPDHARRAIGSALDCQAAMPDIDRALHEEGLLPKGDELKVRVGITTGEGIVGKMGSVQKTAYTAIGDSVNLAARLESANKFFGTRILVNGPAWEAGNDGLLGRPIGKVIVVGKTEPVEIWEPLARADDADDAMRQLVEDFTKGVELYAAGDFEAARDCFIATIGRCDDAASRAYLGFCEAAINDPPDAVDFDGVIQLTEK